MRAPPQREGSGAGSVLSGPETPRPAAAGLPRLAGKGRMIVPELLKRRDTIIRQRPHLLRGEGLLQVIKLRHADFDGR